MNKNQRTSIILTIATASALAVVLAYLASNHDMTPEQRRDTATPTARVITAETITSLEEFENALKCERLILHFDVDWSIQAVRSRPIIAQFKETIGSDLRYRDVVFRRLDCTENGPMLDAARTWFSQQHADDSLMTTGFGAIAWIRSGRVVDTVHDAAQEGVDKLVSKTRMTM